MKRFNLLCFIREHLFDEKHCTAHRLAAGTIIVAFAYGLYTVFVCINLEVVGAFAKDLICGVGVAPYAEAVLRKKG